MVRAALLALLIASTAFIGCDSDAPTNVVIDDSIIDGDTIFAGDHYSFEVPFGLSDLTGLTVFFHTIPLSFNEVRDGRMYFTAPAVATSGTVRAYYNDQRIPFEINHLTVLDRPEADFPRIRVLTREGPEGGVIVVQANGHIPPNDVQLYGGASKLPIDSIYQLPDKGNLLYTRHRKGLSPTNMHAIVGKGYFRLESYNVNAPSSIFPHGSLPSEILLSGRIFGIWDETYSGRDDDDLTSNAMYHDLVAQSGEVSGTSDSVIFTRLIETDTITMRFRIDRTRNELSGTIAMRSLEMDYLYTQFEMEFSGVALEGHSTEINASIADGLAARQISRISYTEHRGPRTTSLERFHYEGTKIDIRLRK